MYQRLLRGGSGLGYTGPSVFLLLIKNAAETIHYEQTGLFFSLRSPLYLYYFAFNPPVLVVETIKKWGNTFIKMVLTFLNYLSIVLYFPTAK